MKNKTAIIAISITAIGAIVMLIFMKRQADEARKVSNDIMEHFRKVDESMKRSNDSIDRFTDSLYKK
jgi:hypothetical protein